MCDTDIITDTRLRFVVMVWEYPENLRYVGPFADVHAANAWGVHWEGHVGLSPCWHTELVDPTAPLPIEPPGRWDGTERDHDGDPPQGPWQRPWLERLSDVGDFYLLQTAADPLHLVGPFDSEKRACRWGTANEDSRGSEYLGWQALWIRDPTAPVPLLTCEQEEARWRP
jgi:hypothetical protein